MIQMKSNNSAKMDPKKELKEVAAFSTAKQELKQEQFKEVNVSSFGLEKHVDVINEETK